MESEMSRHVFAAMLMLAGCSVPAPLPNTIRPSDHFDGQRFFNPDGEQGSGGAQRRGPWAQVEDAIDPAYTSWPKSVPVTPSVPPRRIEGSAMLVTWIGHSTVLVQTDGLNILTDPVWAKRASPVSLVGPRRVREPGVRLKDLPKIDLVLLSHDHYDHLDTDTMKRIWSRDRPLIVTGLENDRLLARYGVTAVAKDWGDRVSVRPGIDVIVDRAHHWSAHGIGDHDRSLWCGFTVTLPGGNLYFAGDTGPGDMHWALAARAAGPVRLALLPIGAYHFMGSPTGNHIGPDDAVTAFKQLGAAYALGVHWGTFELTNEMINQPKDQLADAVSRNGIAADRFRTLEAGQRWAVPLR